MVIACFDAGKYQQKTRWFSGTCVCVPPQLTVIVVGPPELLEADEETADDELASEDDADVSAVDEPVEDTELVVSPVVTDDVEPLVLDDEEEDTLDPEPPCPPIPAGSYCSRSKKHPEDSPAKTRPANTILLDIGLPFQRSFGFWFHGRYIKKWLVCQSNLAIDGNEKAVPFPQEAWGNGTGLDGYGVTNVGFGALVMKANPPEPTPLT